MAPRCKPSTRSISHWLCACALASTQATHVAVSSGGSSSDRAHTLREVVLHSRVRSRSSSSRAVRDSATISLEQKPSASCAHAFILSRSFLPGLLTLLSSLERLDSDVGCEKWFVWHPRFKDTVLSGAEQADLEKVCGRSGIRMIRANDKRVEEYMALNLEHKGAYTALLKLELFWQEQGRNVVYLDTDMLVLRPFSSMVFHAVDQPSWSLHGSSPHSGEYINTGFMAFRTPVPGDIQSKIIDELRRTVASQQRLNVGDQDVVNHALPEHVRMNHGDWYTNYRPESAVALQDWRVVHWSGCNKPWGALGGFNRAQRATPEMDDAWQDACRRLKASFIPEVSCVPSGKMHSQDHLVL